MPISVSASLEICRGIDIERRPIDSVSRESLAEAMEWLGSHAGCTLTLVVADKSLVICAVDGAFTVSALLGNDDFFDLVNADAASAAGAATVTAAQACQPADVPVRHLVQREAALRATTEFLQNGTVGSSGREWERQV
jgi:hypothetical protein